MKQLKQLGHILLMWYSRVFNFFFNLPFNVRLKILVWRYGKGKIPDHEIAKLNFISGGKEAERELMVVMNFVAAVGEICARFNIPKKESQLYNTVGAFVQNRLEEKEVYDYIDKLVHHDIPRRAAYDTMIQLGDLPQRKVDFMYAGELRVELDQWLDETGKAA